MMALIAQFWPFILTGLGVLYGAYQKTQATKHKKEAQIMENKAKQESRRAQVLSKIQEEIIKTENDFNEGVANDVKNANSDYFTK